MTDDTFCDCCRGYRKHHKWGVFRVCNNCYEFLKKYALLPETVPPKEAQYATGFSFEDEAAKNG